MISSVVLATRSEGKLLELVPYLIDVDVTPFTLNQLAIAESDEEHSLEVHATFEQNALAKAAWFYSRVPDTLKGSCAVFADDSGLAVDALDGAPGVRSKRWAAHGLLSGAALDAANNVSLLRALSEAEGNGRAERSAR